MVDYLKEIFKLHISDDEKLKVGYIIIHTRIYIYIYIIYILEVYLIHISYF